MKVLWFEVTTPSNYDGEGLVIGGWQDALEYVVKSIPEIELYIAFPSKEKDKKIVDGVTFIPVDNYPKTFLEKIENRYSWEGDEKRTVEGALRVINEVNPDIVHIFGMEWSWAAVAKHTNIPCVVHIMGSIVPYYNALYPPKYSNGTFYEYYFPNIKRMLGHYLGYKKQQSWEKREKSKWKGVSYYMGRTSWDRALANVLHPDNHYFHVEEALRPQFFEDNINWNPVNDGKIHLISTGCSSFWKGPDMMLKVAYILKKLNVQYEWKVAGNMHKEIKQLVEQKEKLLYSENNIEFLGFTKPDVLSKLISQSSIYVHTAYIENSPNSICEAQLIGIPIISTNVGGIATLVGDAGILVPANDPWQMANAIIELSKNKDLQKQYSAKGKEMAQKRHNPENIKKQLLNCYNAVINITTKENM